LLIQTLAEAKALAFEQRDGKNWKSSSAAVWEKVAHPAVSPAFREASGSTSRGFDPAVEHKQPESSAHAERDRVLFSPVDALVPEPVGNKSRAQREQTSRLLWDEVS
jgi:hypothetical protein